MISHLVPYFSVMFDWGDWLVRKILPSGAKKLDQIDTSIPPRPYKILLSVYNLENDLEGFVQQRLRYKENILLIDDASNDKTVEKAREMGIEIIPCAINKHKPQEIRHGLTHLDSSIETVIVMDPDTVFLERYKGKSQTLEEAVSWFQQTGADASALNMRVRDKSLITRLQDVEYNISMEVGRRSLLEDCVVSGGCAFYKRKALDIILREHSGSVLAEDYESSMRILRKNGRILYNRNFTVETEGPSSLKGITKQRIWWDESIIKVMFESLFMKREPILSDKKKNRLRAFYNHNIYNWGVDVLAYPLKMMGIPFLGLSAANCLESILEPITGTDYIPEIVNSPLGSTYVGPETAGIFVVSYVLLSAINVLSNRLPEKRKYITSILAYPFYKTYLLTYPRMVGFSKGIVNVLKKLKREHKEFMLPKNDYENHALQSKMDAEEAGYSSWHTSSGKQEEYQILFHRTQYHDLYVVQFEKMPEAIKKEISGNESDLFLGVDLEDRFLRIVPFEKADKYFAKKDSLEIYAEPYKVQVGHVCRVGDSNQTRIMYKDYFVDNRGTSAYVCRRNKSRITSNIAVKNLCITSNEPDFSEIPSLHVSMTREPSGKLDWSVHKLMYVKKNA